jgi:hypothetical protein
MLELYTLIYNIINPICTAFADHFPTEDGTVKVYPYAEIKFPNVLLNNEFSDKNLLEVDIWDDKDPDIREIEGLADNIHAALNRLQYNDSVMNVSINRNTPYRLVLPDPVLHIQRRELRYEVTVYKK